MLNELVAGSLIMLGLLIIAAVGLVLGFVLMTVGSIVVKLRDFR